MRGTIRLLRFVMTTVLTVALAIGVTAPVAAEADEAILEEMIALEQSKLDLWYGESDPSAYVAEVADDATAFDAFVRMKRDFGEGIREAYRGFEGLIPHVDYEIVDPAVDVRGDIVIFTFFIEGTIVDDPDAPYGPWNVTKVFNRTADGWEMIHTHFSVPPPPPEE
jgi:ketosteroid isomerase-like protein